MADTDIVQVIAEARVDARSLSEFVFKPANFTVTRRLAPSVRTLQYYIDIFDNLDVVLSSSVIAAQKSLNSSVAEAQGKVAYIEGTVQDAINNTAVEGGVLADTFVTMTANGAGKVARTQRDKNSDTVTPYDFGVVGNFSTLILGDKFDTLEDAQAVYSNATSLTELHDRVAFDRFLLHITANATNGVDWSCDLVLDQPLVGLVNAATKLVSGNLQVTAHLNDLDYAVHLATRYLVVKGKINVVGVQTVNSDLTTRKILHGVVSGAIPELGVAGNGSNSRIEHITGSNLLGYAHYLGADCHFTNIGQVRGSYVGSARPHGSSPSLQGLSDAFTVTGNTGRGDTNSGSTLQITNMRYTPRMHGTGDARAFINGEPFDIVAINFEESTMTVYPELDSTVTTGQLLYVFGGAVKVSSNNTACCTYETIQAIICGYGLNVSALYGVNVSSLITEYCGAGISMRNRKLAALGTIINLGYFESNQQDILYGWSMTDYNCLTITQSVGLSPSKIWNMMGYRIADGVRRADWSQMGNSTIALGYTTLSLDAGRNEITNSNHNRALFYTSSTNTLNITFDQKIAQLTGRVNKTYQASAPLTSSSCVVTVNAPTGFTINSKAAETLVLSDYEGIVTVSFQGSIDYRYKDITMRYSGVRRVKKGTTANRPANPMVGDRYFDTTLTAAGKPISYTGSDWVDATGTIV